MALGLVLAAGCTRTLYRERADRDVYAIQDERLIDPRWRVPLRPVEPDPRSRYRDPADPDREPFPADDPAALQFQLSERLHPWRGFQKRIARRGVAPIEDKTWMSMLPRGQDGAVLLNRETAMQLTVLHNRDYQTQLENLYLAALDVSLQRFRFQVQPFFNHSLLFQHSGAPSNESNQLTTVGRLGLTKNFYSGAQLLVDFANALVFEYNGAGFNTSTSLLTVALTQPLLRGATAKIVTQPLSLQERAMLYAMRAFARFRRGLYVQVVGGGGGYLGLLFQLQAIRNAEENLRNLRRNLAETEALVAAGIKSRSERDQVALTYQQQQLALLQQRAGLQTTLDSYRIQSLGLPPDLPMTLDDAPLGIFELNHPRIQQLREANDRRYLALLQTETAPPREVLLSAARTLIEDMDALGTLLPEARDEMDRWRRGLNLIDERGEIPLPDAQPRAREGFEPELAVLLNDTLTSTESQLAANRRDAEALLATIETAPPTELDAAWRALRDLVGDEYRGRLADTFALQTQVRVFLIELPEVKLEVEQAVAVALANRQDLMNARAQVADAWRNVEVAANALRAGLTFRYESSLATDPRFDGILRLDASNSAHRVGLAFDAPLVRRAERNAYRAAWIAYQRARRAYMLSHDEVVRQVRFDMRQLELSRLQFDINRQQLVTAVRQVELNEYDLRFSRQADASFTLLLLSSLQNLLGAKNSLIGNWVDYETARMGLYRDLDILDIDARGAWTNEHVDPADFAVPGPPPPPGTEPAPAIFAGPSPASQPELPPNP